MEGPNHRVGPRTSSSGAAPDSIKSVKAEEMPAHRSARKAMDRSGQAVVLGGGMAGMLAARVLTDTFEQVTVIERHAADLAGRTGSGPQDDRASAAPPLVQVLSERARPQLERLFPDLPAELTADGAAVVVPFSKPRPTRASELGEDRAGTRLQFTQRFIQRHLSCRLTPPDAIATLHGCDAVGLVSNGLRCVGVQILREATARPPEAFPLILSSTPWALDHGFVYGWTTSGASASQSNGSRSPRPTRATYIGCRPVLCRTP